MLLPFLACGPLLLMLATWARLAISRNHAWKTRRTLCALVVVTANAAFAAGLYTYYHFHPASPSLPPWNDPQTLSFALFFFLAPIGMILAFFASARGGPKWLLASLQVASLPLLLLGFAACVSI